MTVSPEENNNMCIEHLVIAEGSNNKDVEPTQCRKRSTTKKEEGLWIFK